MHELGRAEAAQAHPAALSRHLGRALQVCTDPERRLRIGLDLGRALASAGDFPGAVQAFEQALTGAPDRGWKDARRTEAELLTIALNHYDSTQAARPLLLRRLQDLATGQLDDPALLAVLGMALAVGHPPAASGAEIAARAARGWEPELGSVVPGCTGNALLFAGRPEAAAAMYDRVVAEARARGWRLTLGWASALRANVMLHQGRLREARKTHGWASS